MGWLVLFERGDGGDYEYTLDGLMRLLKARKGNARPGFDDTKGGQQFEYDFLGNLRGFDVDMTAAGDGDFTDLGRPHFGQPHSG